MVVVLVSRVLLAVGGMVWNISDKGGKWNNEPTEPRGHNKSCVAAPN